MLTTIKQQRQECEQLLSLPYIRRQSRYDIPLLLQNPQIKLITGPRRAGKSIFALMMLRGHSFAYLNFDDPKLLSLWNEDLVMSALDSVYPSYQYLLLDEVQNLEGWDLWVAKLYRRGVNLIITGSNAKMLSSEMATVLTGRYVEIEMLPFGLSETLSYSGISAQDIQPEQEAKARIIYEEYLRLGGYPETLQARQMTGNYLQTLFTSIITKDVAQRHRIRKVTELFNLANYLLSNFCNPFTTLSLSEDLGMNSENTVKKFCGYLHEPYLFYYLPRYNNKLKVMLKAPRKVYVVDNGFVLGAGFNLSENLGRLLENDVFLELRRRGYDEEKSLFYYRSRNDKEVDFVTRKGTHVEQLIQVSYDISNERTLKRELSALVECAEELHCDNLLLITFDKEDTIVYKGNTIQVRAFNKWQEDS
ncbi:MAG: ATP-binding protein [Bacteroidales bacterium]|nr:ATP-binding protein [Bacteroidales bacterium]